MKAIIATSLFATLATAANATVISFDNGATDLALFNRLTSAGGASTTFSASATAGVNGGDGVSHATGDATMLYTTTAFDFTSVGATATVSVMMKSSNFASGAYAVGFSSTDNLGFYTGGGQNNISFRDNGGPLQMQTVNAGAATTTGLNTPVYNNNNWYRFELSLTKTATTNVFNYAVMLEDWGVDGNALVSSVAVTNSTGTISNAVLWNDATVYAGVRMTPVGSLDNFSAVPEPTTALLGALGTLTLLRRRRI